MRYDQLAQNALRGVVRDALRKVERSGSLPGDHHFYIQFNTRYPGVSIGERLMQKYPREMTIILQHQFYNLFVHEDGFQVELSFDNVSEKLVIPFAAVKGFLDPAVQFGLQFEVVMMEDGAAAAKAGITTKSGTKLAGAKKQSSKPEEPLAPAAEAAEPKADGEQEKVVSLDAFRKK